MAGDPKEARGPQLKNRLDSRHLIVPLRIEVNPFPFLTDPFRTFVIVMFE